LHYRNSWLYRAPESLPCAFHGAHGKDIMLPRATSPAHGILEKLGIKGLHRALNYKHTAKSTSLPCAEAKPSAKEKMHGIPILCRALHAGARQRTDAVDGHQPPSNMGKGLTPIGCRNSLSLFGFVL